MQFNSAGQSIGEELSDSHKGIILSILGGHNCQGKESYAYFFEKSYTVNKIFLLYKMKLGILQRFV